MFSSVSKRVHRFHRDKNAMGITGSSKRRPRAEITQPHPAAAWLPHELIIHILQQLTSEYDSQSLTTNACLSLVRLCRGWHGPAMSFLYKSVKLTSMTSCLLFLRSIKHNPGLSSLVKSLIVLEDKNNLSTYFYSRNSNIIQNVVAFSSSRRLETLEVHVPPMAWRNKPISRFYPKKMMLTHLKFLHITFPHLTSSTQVVPVVNWLKQIDSLPALEELSPPLIWPVMPCLRRVVFDGCQDGWSAIFKNFLVSPWARNLQVLQFIQWRFDSSHFYNIGNECHNLTTSLEELVLIRPWYSFAKDQIDWSSVSFRQLSSLRPLRIIYSASPGHLLTQIKLPPHVHTLTFAVYYGAQSDGLALMWAEWQAFLRSGVPNVILEVYRCHLECRRDRSLLEAMADLAATYGVKFQIWREKKLTAENEGNPITGSPWTYSPLMKPPAYECQFEAA
ncbi:hypothetical protein JB92DRAFT_3025647 [Gautieria morchelliformis]|nr:hypothetical protein JB92DRAFT_3025647 [Gautieria morchelliformis]